MATECRGEMAVTGETQLIGQGRTGEPGGLESFKGQAQPKIETVGVERRAGLRFEDAAQMIGRGPKPPGQGAEVGVCGGIGRDRGTRPGDEVAPLLHHPRTPA